MEPQSTLAAERAYDAHAAQLYRVAYALLQSRESAEDAVQDAFSRYLAHTGTFQDAEHEKAWLIRVTINRCHDLQRAGAVRAYTPLDDLIEQPASDNGDWENDQPVLRCVLSLPEKYRVVLVLHSLEGQSVDAVASQLRLTPSAVKMRLKRGRELLRTILAKEDIHV